MTAHLKMLKDLKTIQLSPISVLNFKSKRDPVTTALEGIASEGLFSQVH